VERRRRPPAPASYGGPALRLDVALVHLNRADKHGNATYLNRADKHGNATYLRPDPYFDDLFAMAAELTYLSVEQVVNTAGLTVQRLLLSRMLVTGVVETPLKVVKKSLVFSYTRCFLNGDP
jgi:glutaconate CoA-transferase subunit A